MSGLLVEAIKGTTLSKEEATLPCFFTA